MDAGGEVENSAVHVRAHTCMCTFGAISTPSPRTSRIFCLALQGGVADEASRNRPWSSALGFLSLHCHETNTQYVNLGMWVPTILSTETPRGLSLLTYKVGE